MKSTLTNYNPNNSSFMALLEDGKIELFENDKLIDTCGIYDNEVLYNISVGYSDIRCVVSDRYKTMMFLHTDKLMDYTFKEVLSVLVKNNNTPITESANIENFDY